MTIGTSSGKVYETEFDMVGDLGKNTEMPNYQTIGSPDNLMPAFPKLEYRIDREPSGPMPIPESKDAILERMQLAMELRKNPVEGRPRGEGGGGTSRKNWTDEEINKIKDLNDKGMTPKEIASEIGTSKNAVIGKMFREGIEIKSGRSFGGTTFQLPSGQTPSLPKLKFMEGPEP